MTISEQIRTLAGEGLATAEIAKRLGIRYQRRHRRAVWDRGLTRPDRRHFDGEQVDARVEITSGPQGMIVSTIHETNRERHRGRYSTDD